jgi:two-component system sensor histidine kinase YesM
MALKSGAPDISLMVTSLSDFFRFNISQKHDLIPLTDEMRQIESYLTIQKVRFNEKLDYTINVPDELGGCLIIKMLLQPIVENSVLHGIKRRTGAGGGAIMVSAHKDGGELTVLIADDGQEADAGRLNGMLRAKEHDGRRHGAQNVNDRIRAFFGEGYGLSYEENFMGGVTAKIIIPVIHQNGNEGGMDYDPHGDR